MSVSHVRKNNRTQSNPSIPSYSIHGVSGSQKLHQSINPRSGDPPETVRGNRRSRPLPGQTATPRRYRDPQRKTLQGLTPGFWEPLRDPLSPSRSSPLVEPIRDTSRLDVWTKKSQSLLVEQPFKRYHFRVCNGSSRFIRQS